MTENTPNQKANDAIKGKSIRNVRNKTCQTHCWDNLICPAKLIIKTRDVIKRRAIGNGTLSNYAQNEWLLTTAYKSKIITFKLNEGPLHRQMCFLTFMESPEIVFSRYKETWLHMVPIETHLIMFLVKLQRLEWVRWILTTTLTIKLSFKFVNKIKSLSAKTYW